MVTPIFLLSVPRSGSTLMQRILGSSKHISTTSEPWLMLPFVYTLRSGRGGMEYSHDNAVNAIHDLIAEFPGGENDYLREMRQFILRLYDKASREGSEYFLDKTPRYHLIVEDIVKIFPEAKRILLWRNPLAVAASIMETWAGGKWNLYHFKVDLYEGLEGLIGAYQKDSDRFFTLRYEDLLERPADTVERIAQYLDIKFDDEMLENFAEVRLGGRMGDPTGVQDYDSVSKAPLGKWKHTFVNPIRKYWARRYLAWLGPDRLSLMGYSYDSLIREIDDIPAGLKYFFSDIAHIAMGVLYCLLDLRILKRKILGLRRWSRVYANT